MQIVAITSAPSNLVRPNISGTLIVGATLTLNMGSWSGSPTSYSYQLLSNGNVVAAGITKATTVNYTPILADEGATISALVIASNSAGPSDSVTSPGVAISNEGAMYDWSDPNQSGFLTMMKAA